MSDMGRRIPTAAAIGQSTTFPSRSIISQVWHPLDLLLDNHKLIASRQLLLAKPSTSSTHEAAATILQRLHNPEVGPPVRHTNLHA